MKKRLWSAILSLCLLLTMAPTVAFAAETITGSCGEDLTWSLDNTTGTLTISGTGAMPNYDPSNQRYQPWKDNMDNIKTVVIENGVERIGQRSFQSAKNLKELTLNGNVIIGDRAFQGVALEKINGQEYITKIEGRAFKNLNVNTLDLSNVTEIGEYAFESASGLKSITVSDKLLKIKDHAFIQSGLTKIELPNQVDITNSTALFYSCKDLESVHLPDTLTKIPAQMFQFSDKLKTVNIPSTVTTIGEHAFNSAAVNAFLLPNLTEVGDDAFINLVMGSGIYVPNVSTAGLFTSGKYSSDKSFIAVTNGGTFPDDTVFEAGKLATPVKEGSIFRGWYASSDFSDSPVTNATAGHTYYAKWAPASGTCGAAGNEDNVTWELTANKEDTSTYTLTISGTGDMANLVTLRGDLTVDQNNQPWASAAHQITKLVLNEGITSIGDGAFYDMPLLKSADIPASVTKIGVRAFNWANTMGSLTFAKESKLKEIGYAAFNTIAASDVTIPASVEKIDKQAFGNDSNLTTVLFEQGSALKEIGENAFFKCGKLTKLILPEGLTTIGNRAFNNENTSLTTVVIPSTVTSFGEEIYNTQNGCLYFANSEVYSHYTKPQIIKYCMAVMNDGMFTSDTVFTAGTLSKPAKSGYKFIDWYSDAELNNPATAFEAGSTYYAKWTEKTTPAIAIKATPDTLTGGGSVELTVSGVPTDGQLAVTCDNDIKVNEKDGKYTAALPNETKDYTFKADYTGTDLYNNASDTCVVSVTYKGSSHHSSSSSSSSTSNTVSASTASNGKVALDKSTAKKGDTVTVTVTPDAGYQLDKLTVTDAKSKTVDVTKKSDGKYTFTMPDSKVTITPTFSKIEDTKPSKNGFDDVASSDWFADAVKYVADKGLMNGTDDNQFSPNASTTRGMLMTVLARYAGEDTTGGATWYEKSMEWAKAKGVSDGTNPNANITREQLVTMLYRYAGSPKADGKLDSFSDAASVSTYAASAMQWAVANGIVNGSNGKLNPQDNATRAEVAAILMRFCEMSK